MKKHILILILSFGIFSCKEVKKDTTEAVAATAAVEKCEIKLFTFNGGKVFVNKLEVFSQDETYKDQTKEFSNPFYVIQHPKGILMWDAGLPENLIGQPDFIYPGGAFTFSRKDSLANQLKTIDMTVDDIDFIALSHIHSDHSGHANALKNSTWLVQEVEYDFITSDESQKNNADGYNAIKELTKVKKLTGDYDVFGDGSVVIKSMPGHTPGHQVLYLDLVKNGPTLLSGDLYHLYENREHKRIPIFNFDVDQTLKSMAAFEAFAKEQNAKVYIQHQKEDFEKMPVAPKYLN